MALKIENECFFQREKEDRRNKEKGGRTAGPLLAEVPTSWEQNEGMLELSVHLPLPGAEHSPQPPSPPGKQQPLAQSGTVVLALSSLASWQECSLTHPKLSEVHLLCSGDQKQMWDTPLSCDHPISQALTCFHKHLGKSPDLSQEDCLGGRAEPTASGTTAPWPHPVTGWVSWQSQQTVGTRDCCVSQSLQFGDKPHTVWFISW